MIREAAPLWTAASSRFAGWGRGGALAGLLGLAILLRGAARAGGPAEAPGDPTLYAGAVEALRHGGEYYPAVAAALRSGEGVAGALAFPPPTLAAVAAILPRWTLTAALFALAAGVLAAWVPAFRSALALALARWGASLLLVAGLIPYLLPGALYLPEVWAGLFTALSLARWARGAWVEAAALGLCAALLREAAGLFLLVMLLFAGLGRAWREAAAWSAALAMSAVAALAHRRAAADALGLVTPLDPPATDLDPLADASAVAALPGALPILALATFGWLAWRNGAGARLAATVWAVASVAALRADLGGDWGYLVVAPVLAGLAFVPDGVRDLGRAAFPKRRRITVKRVVR